MDEQEFDEAWAEIEAVSPVPLDPSKVGEALFNATAVHPLREQILSRTEAGEKVGIRLVEPDHEAVRRGDLQAIKAQLYLEEGEGGPFISIYTASIAVFAEGM